MRTRSLTATLAALAATAALLLAACADEPGDDPEPTDPPTVTPVPPTIAPPTLPTTPVPVPPISPPVVPPTDRSGETTITGQVTAGVEPGCVLLQTDTGEFLLFGAPAEGLQFGDRVTLRGKVHTDLATTCQQGVPFEVTEVLR